MSCKNVLANSILCKYPATYNVLATFARDERDVWRGTIPMPVASFLDTYGLSSKHVFVVTTHAGSGAGSNRSAIQQLEPDAIVSTNVLAVRVSSVGANTSGTVDDRLNEIGF